MTTTEPAWLRPSLATYSVSKDSYRVGMSPPSYDKQFVRDYLETLDWNKEPPAPKLPPDVIARTSEKYREALQRLTGRTLA